MSQENKHTQGPWFVNGKSEIHTKDAWQKPIAITFNKDVKAGSVSKDQAEANARLIAAAPELLEALEEFISHSNYRMTLAERATKEKAKVAINKAKGIE